MKPATPLPWTLSIQKDYIGVYSDTEEASPRNVVRTAASKRNRADAEYVVHACNAYPKLVEALRCADNPLLKEERAELLRKLGEQGPQEDK